MATEQEKADKRRYDAIIPALAEACEVEQRNMASFVTEIHHGVTGNRVADEFMVTLEAYHDLVTGAFRVQERHGLKRGAEDTCYFVAKKYTYWRPRDYRLRQQTASETVLRIVSEMEREGRSFAAARETVKPQGVAKSRPVAKVPAPDPLSKIRAAAKAIGPEILDVEVTVGKALRDQIDLRVEVAEGTGQLQAKTLGVMAYIRTEALALKTEALADKVRYGAISVEVVHDGNRIAEGLGLVNSKSRILSWHDWRWEESYDLIMRVEVLEYVITPCFRRAYQVVRFDTDMEGITENQYVGYMMEAWRDVINEQFDASIRPVLESLMYDRSTRMKRYENGVAGCSAAAANIGTLPEWE